MKRKKSGRRKDSHKPINPERGIEAIKRRGKQVSRRTPYL